VLLVVVYPLIHAFVYDNQCYTYIGIIHFLIILQENIDTVTVERDENVGEEDCIKFKTEEDYIEELVRTVKCEQEVSVVCWCILW
jgi:hypothetical protein